MTAAVLITLRETLETSLVVGIVLAYLDRTEHKSFRSSVWLGVAAGVLISILLGVLLSRLFGEFSGRSEQIFEGSLMILAVVLMSWMIFWMMRHGSAMRRSIEQHVSSHVQSEYRFGVFLLILFTTLREGTETVIFLQAALLQSGSGWHFVGALLGIGIAVVLSILLFAGIRRISLRHFFLVVNVLLILFSAGLLMHGAHEFQEAGFLSEGIEHVWNISQFLSQESFVGGSLRQLFGYSDQPSLIELLVYVGYIVVAGYWWKRMAVRK